ncbi:hypothetical protein D3C72_2345210 [compost metagenome]
MVIEVGVDFASREFVSLGRIERDDVVDILGDHQGVGRGSGIGSARSQRQGERGCQKGSAEEFHVRFSLGVGLLRTGLLAPV